MKEKIEKVIGYVVIGVFAGLAAIYNERQTEKANEKLIEETKKEIISEIRGTTEVETV